MECDLQSIRHTLDIISGKWKTPILWLLTERTYRFNELLRTIPNVTRKVLVEHLRQLENDKLIIRTVYEVMPPKVEYKLSEHGRTLIPVFEHLNIWGQNHDSFMNLDQNTDVSGKTE